MGIKKTITVHQHPKNKDLWITNNGLVFQELKPFGNDYQQLTYGGRKIRVHTLVAETFHGLSKPNQEVRHLDGNPQNNGAFNLAWGTRKENCQDTIKHNRTTRGAKNKHCKLTEKQVREIRHKMNYTPTNVLAKEFGVSEGTICDIKYNRTWTWLQ